MNIDDIRDIFPGATDTDLQDRLDEVLAWVKRYVPCFASLDEDKSKIVRSLVRRALRYDKQSSEGAVSTKSTGPYSATIDTRRPLSSNMFSDKQIEVLQSLCQPEGGQVSGPYSISFNPPRRPY